MVNIKKAVILAGGRGTRIRTEESSGPKPMVTIGQMPIIWHIMKNLHSQGVSEFVICLGYKGDEIKDFFLNYQRKTNDVVINSLTNAIEYIQISPGVGTENWKITLADTGLDTMTGGRINRVRKYLGDERFLCTYGDGLADINLGNLYDFHVKAKKIATVTAVHPQTRFGNLKMSDNGLIQNFSEKPPTEDWVNGGFFIFEQAIFEYLDDYCILEQTPMQKLVKDQELVAYQHTGFWRPMDTYRESQELNLLYLENQAPWVNWGSDNAN